MKIPFTLDGLNVLMIIISAGNYDGLARLIGVNLKYLKTTLIGGILNE